MVEQIEFSHGILLPVRDNANCHGRFVSNYVSEKIHRAHAQRSWNYAYDHKIPLRIIFNLQSSLTVLSNIIK